MSHPIWPVVGGEALHGKVYAAAVAYACAWCAGVITHISQSRYASTRLKIESHVSIALTRPPSSMPISMQLVRTNEGRPCGRWLVCVKEIAGLALSRTDVESKRLFAHRSEGCNRVGRFLSTLSAHADTIAA